MTKATDAIARLLMQTDSYPLVLPEPPAKEIDLEARHSAKLEKEYRELLSMNRRYGIASWSGLGIKLDIVEGDENLRAHVPTDILAFAEGVIKNGGCATAGIPGAAFRTWVIFLIAEHAPPVDVEAMRAELHAVHSDLGDASQAVFDMLETLRTKEAEIVALRAQVSKLDTRVMELKADLERVKAQL